MKLTMRSTKIKFAVLFLSLSKSIVCTEPTSSVDYPTLKTESPISAMEQISKVKAEMSKTADPTKALEIVFSDLDGTLLHYPERPDELLERTEPGTIVKLPPSSTGLVGVISSRTLCLCREVRASGKAFVLISGMRASTMLKRLPYLPKADAYCCEAGGRIFYPVANESAKTFRVEPISFEGANSEDTKPFYLKEDVEWRNQMEDIDAAGMDGFAGHEIGNDKSSVLPLSERKGALWSHARTLEANGYTVDLKGYAACFRINRAQQLDTVDFDTLLVGNIPSPKGLSTSTNLGCIDVYPSSSGKKNCCRYLTNKLCQNPTEDSLAEQCVCLCDDDNDIEMALACLHAYIPSATSTSMVDTIEGHPSKFTLTTVKNDGIGTKASENALELILRRH